MILECARRRMDVAVAVGDDRRTIEHHRVLAADDVEVGQRASRFAHAIGDQRVALRVLVAFERRGVGHQHESRARFHRARQRFGEPQVFADHHADARAVDVEDAGLAIGIDVEVTALVEHRVVGQLALAIGLLDRAVAQHARGVVDDRAGRLRPTDDSDDARRGLRDARDRRFAIGEEARTQQEIFGRIAADRELGEQHDVPWRSRACAIRETPIVALNKRLTALGEPFIFGSQMRIENRFIARQGLRMISDVGSNELRSRYLPAGFVIPAAASPNYVCIAEVPARR